MKKNIAVKLLVHEEKLNATRTFLKKKKLPTLEAQLADSLSKIYEKVVPKDVRTYIDSNLQEEPSPPSETPDSEQNKNQC